MIADIILALTGTVADWHRSVCEYYGKPQLLSSHTNSRNFYELLGVTEQQYQKDVTATGGAFWASMHEQPYCIDLFRALTKFGKITITADPLGDPMAAMGQIRWMQKRFGQKFNNVQIGGRFDMLASPSTLLIDDTEDRLDAFHNRGGQCVLFPKFWNNNSKFSETPIDLVVHAINKMNDMLKESLSVPDDVVESQIILPK